MAIEKSEIKMAVAHELGCGFDDALEKAQQDIHRWEGAKTAFKEAAAGVEALCAHIQRDLKEEKFDATAANAARNYVRRAAAICENLRLKAEVHEQRAHGRVEALETSVKLTKKLYDAEEAKLQALKEHQEGADDEEKSDETPTNGRQRPPSRPVGARPPSPNHRNRGASPDSSSE